MASGFYVWSTTANANGIADASVNFQEGQLPGSLNDSNRAAMARLREYANDITGALVTTGTATAYAVASNQNFDSLTHLNGQVIAFSPNATSTNAVGVDVTLNVDGLGAKPVRMQPSVALPNGTLILGTPYIVVYNNSDGVFYLHNMVNPYAIPISAGFDYWGPSAPNSCFAFPIGQAISRTTYASLFSGNPWSIGTTYGSGDGSTTFNLPDKTGRVSAMKEATATRLTTAKVGVDGATLGAAGGGTQTLVNANLPPYTPAGSVSSTLSGATAAALQFAINGTGATPLVYSPSSGSSNPLAVTGTVTSTFTGSAQGGTSTPINVAQPTIVCNYVMRCI
jgi:microcystin-dependent protein